MNSLTRALHSLHSRARSGLRYMPEIFGNVVIRAKQKLLAVNIKISVFRHSVVGVLKGKEVLESRCTHVVSAAANRKMNTVVT